MIDYEEIARHREAIEKHLAESSATLARIKEERRAWDVRKAFLDRRSFSLPEAFELLRRLEPESLEARHVNGISGPPRPLRRGSLVGAAHRW